MYTSRPATAKPSLDSHFDSQLVAQPERMDISALLDPTLLQAARYIYRTYFEVHPDHVQRPLGVAIDLITHRGKLIFRNKPILLPQECFVPISQIDSDLR